MLRTLALSILLCLVALVALPFLASSLYIDSKGVIIPGTVNAKREYVTVHYSTWKTTSEMTVEYSKPDGSGVSFFGVRLSPPEYDAFHAGQVVNVHYLRQDDVPDVPLAKFLRHSQLLPTARLAGKHTFSNLELAFTRNELWPLEIAGGMILLLSLWRMFRIPGFGWAVAACVVLGLGAAMIEDFPTPTPMPSAGVRQASGRVKSIDRIDQLFSSDEGRDVEIGQPMEVVGVEFIPEGRKEAVLAVDVIDAGSLPGLQEKAPVRLAYESLAPRTAYIQGASRQFVSRNIAGLGRQAMACLLVIAVLIGGSLLWGRAYKRLTQRRLS